MINVLDHGFVRLVNSMGSDSSIVQAARVSYGEGTKTVSDDRTLIRYLMRHRHTSPFEMVEFVFHVKLPIFVARQWQRHRTGSFNEVSARYSEVKDEFYSPALGDMRGQDTVNKQGSVGPVEDAYIASINMHNTTKFARTTYNYLLNTAGVARELSRIVLPQSTYTEFYWKVNLHNLLHFLKLRTDSHAQKEIRVYAEAIESIIKEKVPVAYEAWVDYVKESFTLSRMEFDFIRKCMGPGEVFIPGLSKRELDEFNKKFFPDTGATA